jgi:naphthoate synthase
LFGVPAAKLGLGYGLNRAQPLVDLVGPAYAKEMFFTGRQFDAREAEKMGLVNRVVPYEELETETVEWCREMLQHSPMALRCIKAALNADCDGQAGLHQNYFRDYDPATGRYVESDPVGLRRWQQHVPFRSC